jgi:hypothetical protein
VRAISASHTIAIHARERPSCIAVTREVCQTDGICWTAPGNVCHCLCAQTILGKDIDGPTLAALKAWKQGDA